jgi:hypothetical protein
MLGLKIEKTTPQSSKYIIKKFIYILYRNYTDNKLDFILCCKV